MGVFSPGFKVFFLILEHGVMALGGPKIFQLMVSCNLTFFHSLGFNVIPRNWKTSIKNLLSSCFPCHNDSSVFCAHFRNRCEKNMLLLQLYFCRQNVAICQIHHLLSRPSYQLTLIRFVECNQFWFHNPFLYACVCSFCCLIKFAS